MKNGMPDRAAALAILWTAVLLLAAWAVLYLFGPTPEVLQGWEANTEPNPAYVGERQTGKWPRIIAHLPEKPR